MNNINRCSICQFEKCSEEGEMIPDGYNGYSGNSEITIECTKKYTEQHMKGGLNCRGFKEREDQCLNCEKASTVSSLVGGFCSTECKEKYKSKVKHYVEVSKKELFEVNSKINGLTIKNEQDNEEYIDLLFTQNGIINSLEAGQEILSRFKAEGTK